MPIKHVYQFFLFREQEEKNFMKNKIAFNLWFLNLKIEPKPK